MFGKKKDDGTREKLREVLTRQERQERRLNDMNTRLNYLRRVVEVQRRAG